MKSLVMIGGMTLAAAAGAGICYLILAKPDFTSGPGNGAITCPGSSACPEEALVANEAEAAGSRSFYGLAFPKGYVSSGRVRVCDGTQGPALCPPGFRGVLVRGADVPTPLKTCVAGSAPCQEDYDAVYCVNPNAPKAPSAGCAVLPEIFDPGYEP